MERFPPSAVLLGFLALILAQGVVRAALAGAWVASVVYALLMVAAAWQPVRVYRERR